MPSEQMQRDLLGVVMEGLVAAAKVETEKRPFGEALSKYGKRGEE